MLFSETLAVLLSAPRSLENAANASIQSWKRTTQQHKQLCSSLLLVSAKDTEEDMREAATFFSEPVSLGTQSTLLVRLRPRPLRLVHAELSLAGDTVLQAAALRQPCAGLDKFESSACDEERLGRAAFFSAAPRSSPPLSPRRAKRKAFRARPAQRAGARTKSWFLSKELAPKARKQLSAPPHGRGSSLALTRCTALSQAAASCTVFLSCKEQPSQYIEPTAKAGALRFLTVSVRSSPCSLS